MTNHNIHLNLNSKAKNLISFSDMMKYKTEYLKMLFNDIKNGSIGQNMKEKIVKYIAYMSLEDALSIISNDKTLLNKVI